MTRLLKLTDTDYVMESEIVSIRVSNYLFEKPFKGLEQKDVNSMVNSKNTWGVVATLKTKSPSRTDRGIQYSNDTVVIVRGLTKIGAELEITNLITNIYK